MNNRKQAFLFESIDIAPLVFFRICFGLLMLGEVIRYLYYGWVDFYWVYPNFFFTYNVFHWLHPLPGIGMKLLFLALGLLAIFITIGYRYKTSIGLFFIGFTYVFLLDKSYYLNQFYLISLFSFWLIWIDGHKSHAIDAYLKPAIQSNTAPAWMLYMLQFTTALPYFFGGIAKLNRDWINGEPMRTWLAMKTDFPLMGTYFTEEWMIMAFSWGGLLFDLLIIPALLWKRTRLPAFIFALVFHLINAQLFSIGIFPWLMIPATLLFFPSVLFRRFFSFVGFPPYVLKNKANNSYAKCVKIVIYLYLIIQLSLPLRHYLYTGDVHWTEQGNRFSWHMKIKDKKASLLYNVNNLNTGEIISITPEEYLTIKQVAVMKTSPDMILQFAYYLKNLFNDNGFKNITIEVNSKSSLNGHPEQLFIAPNVDLTKVKRPYKLVVPMSTN